MNRNKTNRLMGIIGALTLSIIVGCASFPANTVGSAVRIGARRAMNENPKKKEEIAKYCRDVGVVACAARGQGGLTADTLIAIIQSVPLSDPDFVDIRDVVVGAIKDAAADRAAKTQTPVAVVQADSSPPASDWLDQLARALCTNLDLALKDVGLPGVPGAQARMPGRDFQYRRPLAGGLGA